MSFVFDNCFIEADNIIVAPELDAKYLGPRQSARLFKHMALQKNDYIIGLDYKAREMLLYKEELQDCKWHKRIEEKILLFFNGISNNYGRSWGIGVLFTLCSALIFTAIIMSFGTDGNVESLGQCVKGFIGIANVFNFSDSLAGLKLNAVGSVIGFLSKIVVSYGIYQTVSAFRKHGKYNSF